MALEPDPCPCHVELIAREPARNIHRRYAIEATPDLFGAIVVRTAWGRIGARGQEKIVSFVAIEDARYFDHAGVDRQVTGRGDLDLQQDTGARRRLPHRPHRRLSGAAGRPPPGR